MINLNVLQMVANQNHIFQILKQAKAHDRLSHAYLFYGDEGVGKKEMAYALACLFYCPHDGCLECDTCRSIIEGKHLNVDYIGIEANKKLISKEQITELQEEFSKTSLVDGYRIYIVDGIDTASQAAQNSLLKFIEEPINNTPTIGIFIATELANVVSTIVSRCALIHFPSIATKSLVGILKEMGLEQQDAELISLITNDASLGATLVEDQNYLNAKELLEHFWMIKSQKEAILFLMQYGAYFQNEIVSLFFKWLIAFYEDVFKINDKECLILTHLYDKILLYAKMDEKLLKRQFSCLLELYSKLNYNVTAKNIMHELMTKLF